MIYHILFVKVRDFRVIHPIFNFQNTTNINKSGKTHPIKSQNQRQSGKQYQKYTYK